MAGNAVVDIGISAICRFALFVSIRTFLTLQSLYRGVVILSSLNIRTVDFDWHIAKECVALIRAVPGRQPLEF